MEGMETAHTVLPYTICSLLKRRGRLALACLLLSAALWAGGCGSNEPRVSAPTAEVDPAKVQKGARDNTPLCLTTEAPGTLVYETPEVTLDASHTDKGYFCVRCSADAAKIKLQVAAPNDVIYTYNLKSGDDYTVIPLSLGDGVYRVGVYTNLQDNMYAAIFSQDLEVTLEDALTPFLYPNTFVDFQEGMAAVDAAEAACYPAADDLEAVAAIYGYVTSHLTYDYVKAATVESGYIPDVDAMLAEGKGICFDYASLMAAMLRSQQIPARLEIGYAGTVYHAWISTYIREIGWIDGIIHFDGTDWSLMDPTVASNAEDPSLNGMADSSQYRTLYMY